MTATGITESPARRRNPYRGPREFRRGDRLPNRQREARELADRLVADRVVLLHAPSGAGKTSLIEAAVVHELSTEGFEATPRLRVNQPAPDDGVRNPYIFSLICYLLVGPESSEPPREMSLQEAVDSWRRQHLLDGRTAVVLILDQLEEVLILDPTDWDAKEAFFRELGQVLGTGRVWALLSMREDYMGGLDRYLTLLPGHLRSRFRLDFLTWNDAKLAMQVPAIEQRVQFADDAAEALVKLLAVVKVQRPGTEPRAETAPYVEPFQLQVVCRLLWKRIRKVRGDNFPSIEISDVEEHADIEQALTLYFGETVASVVKRTSADERKIRDWFEFELITKQHYRSQTLNPPDTANADQVLALLEDGYLIRGDVRALSTWYELAHDRLIGPVLASNDAWRRAELHPWQIAAYEWDARDRRKEYLLTASQIPGSLQRRTDQSPVERAFVTASENEIAQRGVLARARSMMSLLALTAVLEALLIIALLSNLVAG
jgi:hypothetical protein